LQFHTRKSCIENEKGKKKKKNNEFSGKNNNYNKDENNDDNDDDDDDGNDEDDTFYDTSAVLFDNFDGVDEESIKRMNLASLNDMLKTDMTFITANATCKELVNLTVTVKKTLTLSESNLWSNLASISWMYHIIPSFIINKLVHELGPQFCSNVVNHTSVDDAVGISNCIDTSFIADMTPFNDPASPHIQAIVNGYSNELRLSILHILHERKAFYQLARLHDGMPDDLMQTFFENIVSLEHLIAIARFVQAKKKWTKWTHKTCKPHLPELKQMIKNDEELAWFENAITFKL